MVVNALGEHTLERFDYTEAVSGGEESLDRFDQAVLDSLADRVERFEVTDRLWRRNNALHGLERLVVTVS